MNVCVIGTGYVGLVVGVCLSNRGILVRCVDNNIEKIENLKNGILPIYEPGLDELVTKNVQENRLSFSTEITPSLKNADVVYLAVGTPPAEDGSADLQYIFAAAEEVAKNMSNEAVVIIKSTVPVGTSDEVLKRINKHTNLIYDVVSNPEFLKEGSAIPDFENPDRIVVGYRLERSKETVSQLYTSFSEHDFFWMDNRSAELTKYAANAMLATRISFMNELALLCDAVGADILNVKAGAGSDSRIGPKFLNSGIGYGGSCFPKDVQALYRTAKKHGVHLQVIDAVEKANYHQKAVFIQRIIEDFGENLQGKTIALWGLAFKPETDDIREAPALVLIQHLVSRGAQIKGFDPEANKNTNEWYKNWKLAQELEKDTSQWGHFSVTPSKEDAITGCDILILVTEWKQFRSPNWLEIKHVMSGNVIYDGRNIFQPKELTQLGFRYVGVGRGVQKHYEFSS
jgi:UDPglucose 6-dehydrogenase